jgi:hypothetical protein
MIRRITYEVLLFLLPFALYGVYWRLSGRGRSEEVQRPHPWATLFISGLVLVAASFFLWAYEDGEAANGTYVPPHVEDGRIVPGHVDPGR